MPTLSVIVPIYNVAAYLGQCLNSIVGQTYKDLEIILVNDGSTDNSPEICARYAQQDKRIKLLHKANGGLSSARNLGLEQATGKYIAFVDSDDWLELNIYEQCIKTLEADASLDVCIFGFSIEKRGKTQVVISERFTSIRDPQEYILEQSRRKSDIAPCVWNKVYRSEIMQDLRFPEGRVYEDIAYTCQIFHLARAVTYLPVVGIHYRRTNESSISYQVKENILDLCRNLEELRDRYLNEGELQAACRINTVLLRHLRHHVKGAQKLKIYPEYRSFILRTSQYPLDTDQEPSVRKLLRFQRFPELSPFRPCVFMRLMLGLSPYNEH